MAPQPAGQRSGAAGAAGRDGSGMVGESTEGGWGAPTGGAGRLLGEQQPLRPPAAPWSGAAARRALARVEVLGAGRGAWLIRGRDGWAARPVGALQPGPGLEQV